jgi:phosphopantetheine--protein transferase-like protein
MGIGIDIVEIERFGNIIDRWGDKFLNRIFSYNELSEWETRGKRLSLLAGKFATKEAFLKADKSKVIKWKEIEVLDVPLESPMVWFKGQKKELDLSISHTDNLVVSVVMIK